VSAFENVKEEGTLTPQPRKAGVPDTSSQPGSGLAPIKVNNRTKSCLVITLLFTESSPNYGIFCIANMPVAGGSFRPIARSVAQ